MTDRELSITMREDGRSLGMCDRFYDVWKDDDDIDTILQRFVPGHDFCVEKDYPKIGFTRANIPVDALNRNNIYLDEDMDMTITKGGHYALIGKCTGEVRIDGFIAVTLFVRHESDVRVCVSGGARVFVRVYENGHAVCTHDDISTVNEYYRNK